VTTETEKKPSATPPASKPKGKKKSSAKDIPAGLSSVASAGETMAISASRRLDFPFYFPKLGVSSRRQLRGVRDADAGVPGEAFAGGRNTEN